MEELQPALLLVVVVGVVGLVARRLGVPPPALLVGVAAAYAPGVPDTRLDPELVLVLFLPALLYSAALQSSVEGFRANARPIALLSVGLVLATTLAVGLVAHAVVPGLPLPAAFALGAVLGPPDAVAALAVGRRVGMPPRLFTLIEGENLVNDATALVTYQVAVAATVSGGFSLLEAGGRFVLAVAGGVGVGPVVALLVGLIRRHLDDPLVENALSLVTPFAAFVPAEQIHGSGILAVVVCGLVLGHASPLLLSGGSRLQTGAVWALITFLIEGVVFVLIGLQLPAVFAGLQGYAAMDLVLWSAAIVATVVVVRPLWILPATWLPRLLSPGLRARDPMPPWQLSAALSWAGMRGVVSLAAVVALPLVTDSGEPFPPRDLLVFLAFVAIVTTLLVQGTTFGPLLRRLGLRADRQGQLLALANAQQAATQAAVRRLDQVLAEEPGPDGVGAKLRAMAEHRANSAWERLGDHRDGAETPSAAYRRLRGEMIDAERAALLGMRAQGRLTDELMRELQRELDLEEMQIRRS